MPISIKAIDALFERLTATYGRRFTSMYDGIDPQSVKTAWATELDYWGSKEGLASIAWALENLPEDPPNPIQFKKLVRSAPPPEVPRLPEPKADPERLKAELEKLGAVVGEMKKSTGPNLDWARRIVVKHKGGLKVPSAVLKMAREALNERSA